MVIPKGDHVGATVLEERGSMVILRTDHATRH